MKFWLCLVLFIGITVPRITFAEDAEAIADGMSRFWAKKAREHRIIKEHNRNVARRRRRSQLRGVLHNGHIIPPWVKYKGDAGENAETVTEPTDENGMKELAPEDEKLWESMDLDKDGKLSIAEYERYARSPQAMAYVANLKADKAIRRWATDAGIEVDAAKKAMAAGAQAQAQAQYQRQVQDNARRVAIQRAAQRRASANRAREMNYYADIGRKYYRYAKGRDEL